jgi:hypothetical protein
MTSKLKTAVALTFITFAVNSYANDSGSNQMWESLGRAMQGAANNLNQQSAQMRQNSANNGGSNVNCTTTNYETGMSNTTCDGPVRNNMTCTTTNLGAGMVRTTCF